MNEATRDLRPRAPLASGSADLSARVATTPELGKDINGVPRSATNWGFGPYQFVANPVSYYTLSVQVPKESHGRVSAVGIACGDSADPKKILAAPVQYPYCDEKYPAGTVVTLVATPDPGGSFVGWAGGGCSGTGTCMVTLNTDTAVSASFKGNVQCPCQEGP
jgi:hypothetical protein